jgi:nucleoid DNA-binding protein
MSNVLFASTLAQRACIDVDTADRVIESWTGLIRDMVLAGAPVRLTGVGTLQVEAQRLVFKPVQRMTRIAPAATP